MTAVITLGLVLGQAIAASAQTDPTGGQSPTTDTSPATNPPETKPPETTAPGTSQPPKNTTPPGDTQQRAGAADVTALSTPPGNGSITVEKQTDPSYATGSFVFTLSWSGTCGSGSDQQTLTGDNQTFTWNNVATTGCNWSLGEAVPTGWALQSSGCEDSSSGTNPRTFALGTTTDLRVQTCTFTDITRAIRVEKETNPDGLGPFNFTLTTGGQPVQPSPVPLSDEGSFVWSGLAAGTYQLTESVPAGFTLTTPNCDNVHGSTDTDIANGKQIVLGEPNAGADCHDFTNTTQQISITKQTTPDGAPGAFNFQLEVCNETSGSNCTGAVVVPPNPQSIGDGQTATWPTLLAGRNYRLTETVPSGWTLTNRTCSGVNGGQNSNTGTNGRILRLQAGDGATCTFTDTSTQATIRIFKGGDRTGVNGNVGALDGAVMGVYSNSSLTTLVGQCTTGAPFPSGQCDVTVAPNTNYWVAEISSPSPFNKISQLTISSGGTQNYSIAIPSSDVGPGEVAVAPPTENIQGNDYQRRFANRRNNAEFPNTCGISIALLFDNSSSISTPELNQMKAAGVSFSNALQGTPSQIGVYRFASSAATLLGQTNTTPAGVTSINSAINGIPQGGGSTNWDAGFQQVANVNADLVIIMTDGNPTISNVGGSGNTTTFWDLEEGIASANLVKAGGPKVLALGIGDDVSPLNLQAISGPIQGPVAGNYDYAISNFDTVKNNLVDIATRLCGATVNVTKLLDGQASSGWTFTPTAADQGATFTPNPGVTDNTGQVSIKGNPIPENGTNVTITETQKPNTTFSSVSCTKNGQPIGTPGQGAITFPVNRQDTINCTFNNVTTPGAVKVVKATTPAGGQGPFPITLTGPNNFNQQTSLAGDTSNSTFTPVPAGSGYNVTEAVPAGWTLSGTNCGQGVNPANFTVPAGQTVTCTFTNAVNTGMIKVLKKVDGTQVAGWVVNATNPAAPATISPSQVTTVASGTSDFALSKVVTGGSTTTLSEVLQAGHTAGNVTCTSPNKTDQTGQTGSVNVTVKPGETWTCTFNNTVNTGTIKVLKKVDGQQAAGWVVNATNPAAPATISPSQVTTVASGTSDFALSKVVTGGSTTTLSEVLQAGHTAGAVTCTSPNQTSQTGQAGSVNVTVKPGETWTCTFNNTTNKANVTVVKKVDGQTASGWTFGASTQDPTTVTPPSGQTDAQGELGFALSKVLTNGSPLTLTETLQPGFSLQNATCFKGEQTNVPINLNGLAGTLTANPGDNITCTFNNTTNKANVTIVKKVDGQTAPGWTFGASTQNPASVTPPSGQTDAQGELGFVLSRVLADGSPLTITETAQSGFSFQSASCAKGQTNVPIDLNGLAGTLTVMPGDAITCTFNNSADPRPPEPSAGSGSIVSGVLPFTGSPVEVLVKIALWLLVIGGACLLLARIRRRRTA